MFNTIINNITNKLTFIKVDSKNKDLIKFDKALDDLMAKEEKKTMPKLTIAKYNKDGIAEDNGENYLIIFNNISIGYFVLRHSNFYLNMLWLTSLYIDPKYQNRGFGSQTITYIKQNLIDKKYKYFSVNFQGDKRRNFYVRNGFTSELSAVNTMEL